MLALPLTRQERRSVAAVLRRVRSTTVVASPPLRYAAAALLGALAAGAVAATGGTHGGLLLLCYPVIGVIAGLGGMGAGIAASAGAALGALAPGLASPPPRGLAEEALFWVTLALVALLVGRLADSLRSAHERAEQERLEANEFAAALHLRLMLAEREIERLRSGGDGESVGDLGR